MVRTTKQPQPLPPAVFHLLLALRDGEQHGYALMQRVEELTDGAVRMGPGTLYGAIKRMLADGLITDAGERVDSHQACRKYYKLTELGQKALNAEMQRYLDTVYLIKQRNLIPSTSAKLSL